MKIRLSETKFYFLTCNNEMRKTHIFEEFKDYDLTEVNPVSINIGISKEQSGSTGFSRMMDIATINQDRSKPFQPFMLIEDDIKKYREFPEEFEIPDNADLLYTGLSTWAMTDTEAGSPGTVCCSAVDDFPDLVRVKNMLSTHGFMVCSVKRFPKVIKKINEIKIIFFVLESSNIKYERLPKILESDEEKTFKKYF